MTEPETKTQEQGLPPGTRDALVIIGLLAAAILAAFLLNAAMQPSEKIFSEKKEKKDTKYIPAREGTWRFIVSGDSRNCGDVVMPAIAADSLSKYQPSFYWHLGDL